MDFPSWVDQSAGDFRWPSNSSSSSSFWPQSPGSPNRLGRSSTLLYASSHLSRWLIAHDHEDEAINILADLEGKDPNHPFILSQHKEIVYAVQYEKRNAVPWSKLLLGKTGSGGGTKTMRRIILGAGTQAMQQVRSLGTPIRWTLSDGISSSLAST